MHCLHPKLFTPGFFENLFHKFSQCFVSSLPLNMDVLYLTHADDAWAPTPLINAPCGSKLVMSTSPLVWVGRWNVHGSHHKSAKNRGQHIGWDKLFFNNAYFTHKNLVYVIHGTLDMASLSSTYAPRNDSTIYIVTFQKAPYMSGWVCGARGDGKK